MLKALENQNYKTIWEAVIKNRHPEAESLEEALEQEIEFGCYFGSSYDNILSYILHVDYPICHYNQEWNHRILITTKDDIRRQYSIYGKLITLEDILSLQPDLNCGANGLFINFLSFNKSYEHEIICCWQLTKPLHEQTPETWEAIAKVI